MLKSGRLFQNIQRVAILLNRLQLRQKTHCMDHATIPAPLMGPQTIIIKSPYSVKVEAIDPVQFGHIKAVVGFLYLETETTEELSPTVKAAFQQDIQYNVRAVMSPSRDYMEVTCSEQRKFKFPPKDISMHFHVPVDYGVEIEVTGDAAVDVHNLEGQLYEVITEQGSCHLKNLKGSRLSVETNGGDITCDSQLLFEFGILDTKKQGSISVKKLQGKKFCVDTEDGDIDVKATYLLRAEITSQGGDVRLGDIHGLTEVDVVQGDILVASVSGKLKAVTTHGNINVNLAHHDDITLKSKEGNICIKMLGESVSSDINAKYKGIDINSNVNLIVTEEDKGENFTVLTGVLNPEPEGKENARTITAEAKQGSVNFEKIDWFSSLKFKPRQ